ncbi:hypothetical protein FRX31_019457, partial [Thalictrum thalictroides]
DKVNAQPKKKGDKNRVEQQVANAPGTSNGNLVVSTNTFKQKEQWKEKGRVTAPPISEFVLPMQDKHKGAAIVTGNSFDAIANLHEETQDSPRQTENINVEPVAASEHISILVNGVEKTQEDEEKGIIRVTETPEIVATKQGIVKDTPDIAVDPPDIVIETSISPFIVVESPNDKDQSLLIKKAEQVTNMMEKQYECWDDEVDAENYEPADGEEGEWQLKTKYGSIALTTKPSPRYTRSKTGTTGNKY